MTNRINPWEHPLGKTIWKTKAAFMSFVRGGIRRGLWEKNPLKLDFIKSKRKRVPLGRKTIKNPEGMVWGAECEICHNDFRQADVQVDHKCGNHSLKTEEDIIGFITNMIYIDPDNDLQIVCKDCHSIKTNMDRKGISFEESKAEKKAIQIEKEKRVNETLEGLGLVPASNAAKRRKQLVEAFMKEGDNI